MIRINLLPEDKRISKLCFKKIYSFFAAVFGGIIFFVYTLQATFLYQLKSDVQTLQSKLYIYQPVKAQMDAARQEEATLAEKTATVETVQQGTIVWTEILMDLAALAAPQLWFTDLEAEKGYIRVKGEALDYSFVTAFMDQCSQSELFADPLLIHAGRDEKEPVTKFEIVLKLKGL